MAKQLNFVLQSDSGRRAELSPRLTWSGDEQLAAACTGIAANNFPNGVPPSMGDPQTVIAEHVAHALVLKVVERPEVEAVELEGVVH